MPRPTDHELFDLGDVVLQGGATLRGAQLSYKTYGTLYQVGCTITLERSAFSVP